LFPQFITIVQEEPIITQLTIVIVPLIMAAPISNVLRIQLPLYQIDDDPTSNLQQLTKICVTNGENTNPYRYNHNNDNQYRGFQQGNDSIFIY
jgi:hypothetical protein